MRVQTVRGFKLSILVSINSEVCPIIAGIHLVAETTSAGQLNHGRRYGYPESNFAASCSLLFVGGFTYCIKGFIA